MSASSSLRSKLRPFSLCIVIVAFSLLSCEKEVQQKITGTTTSSTGKITLTGKDASVQTKSTLVGLTTSWIAATDQVGIFSPQARPTSGGAAGVTNVLMTAQTSAALSQFTGNLYWGVGSHDFYAYYPYQGGSPAASSVPISLSSSQIQAEAGNTEHVGSLDFMVAKNTGVAPGTVDAPSTVDLNYNHLFTVLEFQVKGAGSLKAIKLIGNNPLAFTAATIDLTQTIPASGIAYVLDGMTGSNNQITLSLTTAATLTATNSDTKITMVINPGVQTGNCLIGISADGTNWNYLTKAAPVGGFLRGTKYTVPVDATTALLTIDEDINNYSSVTIGTQVWMKENLKTTKFNDGTAIPLVTATSSWAALLTPGYCWYDNDGYNNKAFYGAMYNYYAVATGKLCPTGWHVPTEADWLILTNYMEVNGFGFEGSGVDYAKALATTSNWTDSGTAGTPGNDMPTNNITGFNWTAGGRRYSDGYFYYLNMYGNYWSSTENGGNPFKYYLAYNLPNVYMDGNNKKSGFSVRCLKD